MMEEVTEPVLNSTGSSLKPGIVFVPYVIGVDPAVIVRTPYHLCSRTGMFVTPKQRHNGEWFNGCDKSVFDIYVKSRYSVASITNTMTIKSTGVVFNENEDGNDGK